MDELSRDPGLAGALRDADPVPAADWNRLRASVAARAELPLARRRSAARRRAAGRWAGLLAPLAAAAALAFTLLPGVRPSGGRAADAGEGGAPGARVEEVVEASYPARDVERLISGRADADALLLAALGEADPARL